MSKSELKPGAGNLENTTNLKVLGVKQVEFRRGIKFGDIKQVGEAMKTLASGLRTTTLRRESNITFINGIIESANSAMDTQKGFYSNLFLSGAEGTSFQNSGFAVQRIDDSEGFLLQVTQGIKPSKNGDYDRRREIKLAKELTVERALFSRDVLITLDPEGQKFNLDIAEVAKRLNEGGVSNMLTTIYAVDNKSDGQHRNNLIDGRRIVDQLFDPETIHKHIEQTFKDKQHYSADLGRISDNLVGHVGLIGGRRFRWHFRGNTGTRGADQWTRDDTVISGPSAKAKDKSGYRAYLAIGLHRRALNSPDHLMPLNDEQLKTTDVFVAKTNSAFPVTCS